MESEQMQNPASKPEEKSGGTGAVPKDPVGDGAQKAAVESDKSKKDYGSLAEKLVAVNIDPLKLSGKISNPSYQVNVMQLHNRLKDSEDKDARAEAVSEFAVKFGDLGVEYLEKLLDCGYSEKPKAGNE